MASATSLLYASEGRVIGRIAGDSRSTMSRPTAAMPSPSLQSNQALFKRDVSRLQVATFPDPTVSNLPFVRPGAIVHQNHDVLVQELTEERHDGVPREWLNITG